MTNNVALAVAMRISRFVMSGAEVLRKLPVAMRPVLGVAPLRAVAPAISDEHFDPAVCEILVLGGAARGNDPECLSMAILDRGFYSRWFWDRVKRLTNPAARSVLLRDNLRVLFTHWFNFDALDPDVDEVLDRPVSAHVLPVDFLANNSMRRMVKGFTRTELRGGRKAQVKGRGWNPRLFPYVLEPVLRYEAGWERFVPADTAYFEEKYHCDLADLRVHEAAPEVVHV